MCILDPVGDWLLRDRRGDILHEVRGVVPLSITRPGSVHCPTFSRPGCIFFYVYFFILEGEREKR